MYDELISVTVHYNRVREIRDGRLEAVRRKISIIASKVFVDVMIAHGVLQRAIPQRDSHVIHVTQSAAQGQNLQFSIVYFGFQYLLMKLIYSAIHISSSESSDSSSKSKSATSESSSISALSVSGSTPQDFATESIRDWCVKWVMQNRSLLSTCSQGVMKCVLTPQSPNWRRVHVIARPPSGYRAKGALATQRQWVAFLDLTSLSGL